MVEACLGHPGMGPKGRDVPGGRLCTEACELVPAWKSEFKEQLPSCRFPDLEDTCKVAVPNEKKCALAHLYFLIAAHEAPVGGGFGDPQFCPKIAEYHARMVAELPNCDETDRFNQQVMNLMRDALQDCTDASSGLRGAAMALFLTT